MVVEAGAFLKFLSVRFLEQTLEFLGFRILPSEKILDSNVDLECGPWTWGLLLLSSDNEARVGSEEQLR